MALQKWETPDSYFGFNPIGDYGIYSRHRDSDTLTQSNWECLLKFFKGVEKAYPFEPTQDDKYKEHWDGSSTVPGSWFYTWEASHWAVGWVEYMMLREDAPDKLREIAEETMDDLKNCYPVFDDDHYYNLCWENKSKYWEGMSVKERVYYCQKADVSIFAARRDEMPYDVEEYIED